MAEQPSSSGPISGVAGRFASALLDTAEEAGVVDQVERDLDLFDRMIQESPDLDRLVRSPVFTAEQQTSAISALLDKAGITGIAANFLRLVAAKRRLFAVREMIAGYKSLVAAKKGIVQADVTFAEQPVQPVLDELKAALKGAAGGDIVLNVKIDPSIIGGLVVKLGSRMLDASLRHKLNSIRLAMKEVG